LRWGAGCYYMKENSNYPTIDEQHIHLSEGVNPDWVKERYRRNPVPIRYNNSCDHAIHEWFYRIIKERGIKSVLDVGCGKGYDSMGVQDARAFYMGLDPIPENIRFAKKWLGENLFRQGYVQDLPFDNNTFDCVFMMSVWETLPRDTLQVAIEECCRVAKEYVINVDAGFPAMRLRERWGYIPSGWHPTLTRVVDEDKDKYFSIWDITHNTYKCPVLV